MIIEIHRTKDKPFVNKAREKIDDAQKNKYAIEIEQIQQMIGECKALGLNSQVELYGQSIKKIRKQARKECEINPKQLGYPEITEAEMRIWTTWLPTRHIERQFSNYSFDQIPQEVVEEMRIARTLELFDTLEIRTPEEQRVQDPILIGWLDKVAYLIARWGESLRPFEEIKQLVEKSWRIKKKAMWLAHPFIIGGISTTFVLAIALSIIAPNPPRFLVILLIPCILLVFIGVWLRDFKLNPAAFLDKHRSAVNKTERE